ncbi:MAG TPA: MauE/DoxX family redox-associated membrane protein [Jatrophihabitantaceae bacterium]
MTWTWTSIRPWLGTVARLVLGVVWIWAAWSKLGDPRGFVQAVRAYDATPEWLSKAIGYGLPTLEICLGVLLVVGIITRAAAIVSVPLLVVFLIGIIQADARGLKLTCGCFGGGGTTTGGTSYTLDILRDVGLLVLAVFVVLWPLTRISLDEFLGRNDYVEPPSAKRLRSDQGQRKYNALLEARRKEAQVRTRYVTGSLAIVVVLVSVIGIGVQANRAKIQGDLTATNASVQNGVVVGKAAPVTVDVFEDFQCPICLQFEQSAHTDVAAKIKADQIQVRYHMMAFLDSASSGNRYSSRAANAALCASDINVDTFAKYHDILYGKDTSGKQVQPAENANGRTDTQLIGYARQAGITGTNLTTFQTCVNTEQHKALVEAITENASKRGVSGTPTVMVAGKKLGTVDKASLDAAIAAAAAKAPKPTTTPPTTPATSPSGSGSPSGSSTATPSP